MVMLVCTVTILYSGFIALDVCSIFPRVSGSLNGKNGIGYTFQVMTNTLKRIFVVLYPPALGAVALSGSITDVFFAVMCSYLGAVFVILFLYGLRKTILKFFLYCFVRFL